MSYLILFLSYSEFDFQRTMSAYFHKIYLASEYKPADVLSMTLLFSAYVQLLFGCAGNLVQFFRWAIQKSL